MNSDHSSRDDFSELLQATSFQMILDSIISGVIIVNKAMEIHYMNDAAQQLTRTLFDHVHEMKLDKALHLRSSKTNTFIPWPIEEVMQKGNSLRNIKNCSIVTGKKSEEHSDEHSGEHSVAINYSAAPLQLDDNSIVGATIIFRDVGHEQELLRLKDEFVSIVSHQLRTPASAVKWYLEALIDNRHGNPMNEWQTSKLNQAFQSNERMIHLINDLLNVSRIDSNRVELRITPCKLQEVIDTEIEELAHFASAHNVSIENTITDTIPAVDIDVDKVREVVVNALTNAIKYTKSGHHTVHISAQEQGDKVVFTVHDEGIGIPKKDLNHMFEKFYRADNAIESQTEGSGLGLYIARQIVQLHGGEMTIASVEGEGTTITFSLPISK